MRPAQSRWYAAAALGIALAAVGGWYRARQASTQPSFSHDRAGGASVPGETLQEDADAFVDAFDALMAAGEGAYPGLIALIQEIGEDWSIIGGPKAREASLRYYRNLIIRAPQLGGLLDAILSRGGEPQYVPMLVRAGVAAGADALFLETHFNPPQAWCDAASMIPLKVLEPLLEQAVELGAMTRKWGLA